MRFFKDKNYRKIAIVISIPVLLIAQYYLFKIGIFKPMVKGIEIEMVEGDYIQDLDKFVIKLDEAVTLSKGDYITIPSYSKTPDIWFKELDDSNMLKVEGDKIIGLKEGISSVGIMKDSRVLKKINIKVVKPKVLNLTASIKDDIKYVGDSGEIETVVEVDYDRFKEGESVSYSSTDESVLSITGNKIKAVGVGNASIFVRAGDKEEKVNDYNIKAKIAKIDIEKVIELGVEKTKKLQPIIITSPQGLKYGNIKYELVGTKLPIQRAIRLDNNGTIVGLKEGEEKVKITCGDKHTIVTVKVVDNPIINNKIENLEVDYEVVDNKIIISLVWDYLKGINEYGIYLKNNTLQDKEFSLFETVSVKEDQLLNTNKVKATIEVDLIDGKIPDLSLYVVGKTKTGDTEPSNTVNIKPDVEGNIVDESVENLVGDIDTVNNNIKLTWSKLDISDVTYSVYVKDNTNDVGGFVLYQNGIQGTEVTIPITSDKLDIEIYVVGFQNDKYSNPSNIININK